MGSTASSSQKYFIDIFFDYFLKKTDIYNMTKIVKIIDFINLGPDYDDYSIYIAYKNSIINMYGINNDNIQYEMIDINSNSSIGKKTKNVISIIRNLMIKERVKILNDINSIDVSNKKFNQNENLEEINELTKLLEIENSKIDGIELKNISNISENISNLNNKLYILKNNIKTFNDGVIKRKLFVIKSINISLFISSTNYLFPNEVIPDVENYLNVPYATIISNDLDLSAPSEYTKVLICEK